VRKSRIMLGFTAKQKEIRACDAQDASASYSFQEIVDDGSSSERKPLLFAGWMTHMFERRACSLFKYL
jgi:hypothetical protein